MMILSRVRKQNNTDGKKTQGGYVMNTTKHRQTEEIKTGGIEAAAARYGVGVHTMRTLAKEAGAVAKIGRRVLVNFTVMDAYMDSLTAQN